MPIEDRTAIRDEQSNRFSYVGKGVTFLIASRDLAIQGITLMKVVTETIYKIISNGVN